MIDSFYYIGDSLLNNKNDSDYETKKRFLDLISITPYTKKNKNSLNKPICLNFKLEESCVEFKLFELDLEAKHRDLFFAHSQKGNTKNVFLNTSSIMTLVSSTIPDLFQTLTKEWKKWCENNIDREYIELIEQLYYNFYLYDEKSKSHFLNPEKLCSEFKEKFYKIKEEISNENFEKIYSYLLNKIYFNRESKNKDDFPNVAMLLINGENIQNFKNHKFAESYVKTVYHALLGHHFVIDKIENKFCHICNENTNVLKSKYPLPMKFFGTTNFLFFNDLDQSKAYQSFAICENCSRKTFVGMKYVADNLRDYLFETNYYLIPNLKAKDKFNEEIYKGILKVLQTYKNEYKNELEKLQKLIEKSNDKNISFDLMFYYAKNQMFNILKQIPNIELNNLIDKLEMFDKLSEKFHLPFLGENYIFTLNRIIYHLFVKYKGEKKIYDHKKILNLLSTFFSNQHFLYKELIRNFVHASYNKILHEKYDKLSPLHINLFMKILIDLNMIKGVEKMNKENFATEILSEDYQHFFDAHKEIYANNPHRQGLFLLGVVISQILRAQKNKSSNFLSKINFNGLNARKMQSFINKVKEYTIIYKRKEKFFEEHGIWGNIMDRLQGIELSKMSSDEIIFYILSGISYAEYIARKKSMENKEKEIENFMEENDE